MNEYVDQRVAGRRHLVSQRLRERRSALGLTQQQVVARLGGLGLRTSNRALSSVERGAGLDISKLPEVAAALDCSVTYLLGLTDDPRRWRPDARDAAVEHAAIEHAVVPPAPNQDVGGGSAGRTQPPILGPDVPNLTSTGARGA